MIGAEAVIDIDHNFTDELVCPHCGHKFEESYEFGDSNQEDLGLIECECCGEEFYGTRNISVTYSTALPRYGTCAKCKEENVIIENMTSTVGSYKDLCLLCGGQEKARLRIQQWEELRGRKV